MSGRIGAAGLGAARMADEKASRLLAMIERGGRADWPRLAAALGGSGERLDETVRHRMEALLGHRLDEARLHSGPYVEQLAGHIGAEAFTIGAHVFAPRGSLNPASDRGAGVLAHELTHVVQQTRPHRVAGAGAAPVQANVAPAAPAAQLAMRPARGTAEGEAAETEAGAIEQAAQRAIRSPQANRGEVDIVALAARVYELFKQEVLIERERIGPR